MNKDSKVFNTLWKTAGNTLRIMVFSIKMQEIKKKIEFEKVRICEVCDIKRLDSAASA